MTERNKRPGRRDAWLREVLREAAEEVKSWPPEMRRALERRRQERLEEIRRIKERKYGRPASRP